MYINNYVLTNKYCEDPVNAIYSSQVYKQIYLYLHLCTNNRKLSGGGSWLLNNVAAFRIITRVMNDKVRKKKCRYALILRLASDHHPWIISFFYNLNLLSHFLIRTNINRSARCKHHMIDTRLYDIQQILVNQSWAHTHSHTQLFWSLCSLLILAV